MESMSQRMRLKLQHANRERQRAEIEAKESRDAMVLLGDTTDQAVGAHEAAREVSACMLIYQAPACEY